MEIKIKTLTPIWTGGVDQTCDRLHETGIIGSLRWWYEALVRGLGGYACDPTSDDRCPDQDGKRCTACELFGCTGWGRKFRLQVLDRNGRLIQDAIKANIDLRLQFLELRPISDEEKWLLAKAVEIAAKHGALGGKTTLKPQRDQRKGADYGIMEWKQSHPSISKPDVHNYLRRADWRAVQTKLPDLRWFFFVRRAFLWRRQLNTLMGLSENGRPIVSRQPYQNFLRGDRGTSQKPAVSKKLFSFRVGGGRIWGYAKDSQMRGEIIEQIKQQLGSGNYVVKTGEEVLHEL